MTLTPGTYTDEDLWRSAVGGAAEAWGELFLRHHRAIYNFCFRRTGQWSAAEDLTSAVFLAAWRQRAGVRAETATALPWLYGIATMLTRNHHRSLRRYRNALQRIPAVADECDLAEDASARIDAERQVARMRAAMKHLSQRDVNVLSLAATGDLSHEEIAIALAIPVGTVKSRLSRARERLGREIGVDGDPNTTTSRTRPRS